MTRRPLLFVVGLIPLAIGLLATLAPAVLLGTVKGAAPSAAAEVMARTAGVLLVAIGGLNLAVAGHERSPTLRAVLAFDLVVQLLLLPIDPLAWWSGTFATLGSFVPNTLLHLILAAGFAWWLLDDLRPTLTAPEPSP